MRWFFNGKSFPCAISFRLCMWCSDKLNIFFFHFAKHISPLSSNDAPKNSPKEILFLPFIVFARFPMRQCTPKYFINIFLCELNMFRCMCSWLKLMIISVRFLFPHSHHLPHSHTHTSFHSRLQTLIHVVSLFIFIQCRTNEEMFRRKKNLFICEINIYFTQKGI